MVAVLALAAGCVGFAVIDIAYARWGHAIFSAFNGAFLIYAITRFIGWRESLADIGVLTTNNAEADIVEFDNVRPMYSLEEKLNERPCFNLASAEPIKDTNLG